MDEEYDAIVLGTGLKVSIFWNKFLFLLGLHSINADMISSIVLGMHSIWNAFCFG